MADNEAATRPRAEMTEEEKLAAKEAKKAAKAAEKAAKEAKKAALEAEKKAAAEAALAILNKQVTDFENETYGHLGRIQSTFRTNRKFYNVDQLDESLDGQEVWVRARVNELRCQSKNLAFINLRWRMNTIQAIVQTEKGDKAGEELVKFTSSMTNESVVDVCAKVVIPPVAVTSATQAVELHVTKLHCVSRAQEMLPFQMKDANRTEEDTEGVQVSQEVRLDNRIIDLRTYAMQGVLRVAHQTCQLFREYFNQLGFTEIHTPKLIGGSSEGGANVFKLDYFGREACLAQSPQLYKQMAICSDLGGVFEIGPVFRAENSNTHRHLCEFTGLDMEMSFREHYYEVLEVLEKMFAFLFTGIEQRCAKEIATIYKQWPNTPFQWSYDKAESKILRLNFEDGVTLLREAGYDIPEDWSEFDIGTEQERVLGKLIKEKYGTDFYYMINYPLAVRPFYTMPNAENPLVSNSYDFFMRGEEIVSGAQRIHDPTFLAERATKWGIDVATIKDYIDSFSLGALPHGGAGVGMERVVMLYLGLGNIRRVSMFPRDPKRLTP